MTEYRSAATEWVIAVSFIAMSFIAMSLASSAIAQQPNAQQPKAAAAAPAGDVQPNLLGQYDNWAAYWAAPDGRKICFAAARPASAQTRSRPPTYLFITSRPSLNACDLLNSPGFIPAGSGGSLLVTLC